MIIISLNLYKVFCSCVQRMFMREEGTFTREEGDVREWMFVRGSGNVREGGGARS